MATKFMYWYCSRFLHLISFRYYNLLFKHLQKCLSLKEFEKLITFFPLRQQFSNFFPDLHFELQFCSYMPPPIPLPYYSWMRPEQEWTWAAHCELGAPCPATLTSGALHPLCAYCPPRSSREHNSTPLRPPLLTGRQVAPCHGGTDSMGPPGENSRVGSPKLTVGSPYLPLAHAHIWGGTCPLPPGQATHSNIPLPTLVGQHAQPLPHSLIHCESRDLPHFHLPSTPSPL